MKGIESQSNDGGHSTAPAQTVHSRQHGEAGYQKAKDERKRPIRGLWVRNGRYYAQITLEDPQSGKKKVRRVPLENAATPAQAKAAMDELLVRRRKGRQSSSDALPNLKISPMSTSNSTEKLVAAKEMLFEGFFTTAAAFTMVYSERVPTLKERSIALPFHLAASKWA